MIQITDNHIEEFENRFENLSFDAESRAFIKCIESKDIQACPGAGKTTSLVAKLDIIASQMPFKDNSGVLVLTHTNVAVDEIKKKLGLNAKILLSYPNHIGTFQSFVNKFLAIPMYVNIFGKKPERIDYDLFNEKLLHKLNKYYLNNFIPQSAEANKYTSLEGFINALTVEENRISLPQAGGRSKTIVNRGKPSFRNIKRAKDENIIRQVVSDGYLAYHHCYDLANKYLDDYSNMKEVFQKRFKYVFIDEVQDTDNNQFEIIDKLFSGSDVIIQKIGDKNQEIFSNLKTQANGWEVGSDALEIKNTKRLSSIISEKVSHFAINPQELNGNNEIQIQPRILLFDEKNIGELVLQKFGDLIFENNLQDLSNSKFKAIGAVGKVHESKITIPDYFPSFSKNDNRSLEYETLVEKIDLFDKKKIRVKDYRKILLDVIIEYLKTEDIKYNDKYFSKNLLLNYLKEKDKLQYKLFKLKLFEGVKKLSISECVFDILKEKVEIVLELLGSSFNESVLVNIIKNYKIDLLQKTTQDKYIYSNSDTTFDIEISTIHKVKGETHTATLILESFNRTYDLQQLLKLLKGLSLRTSNTIDLKKKLLYVAMSRPTHLLCFAMNKEHVKSNDISELEECGFIIEEI